MRSIVAMIVQCTFATAVFAQATPRITVTEKGFVGINTAKPWTTLDVNGGLNVSGQTSLGDVLYAKEINAMGPITTRVNVRILGPLVVENRIWGNLGLSLTGPTEFFTVAEFKAGATFRTQSFDSSNSKYSWAMIHDESGQLVSANHSSLRYKTDVRPMRENFERILELQVKSYRHIDSGSEQYGLIAEELDAAGLKQLVRYDQQGRPDGVAYPWIPLYLLEAIKAVDQRNRNQSERIQALEVVVAEQARLMRTLAEKIALPRN